jgi:hypothetical protein
MDQYLQEMQKAEVVALGAVLILICLFWTYGYFRRRSKKRF